MVIQSLKGINKGKAGDQKVDSLDLFIKLTRSRNKGKKRATQFNNRHKTLARFFTSVANAEIPSKIEDWMHPLYNLSSCFAERSRRPFQIQT